MTTAPHIGPSGFRPGDTGYEFDCGLDDCALRYHSLDHRDPQRGVLEIVPPEGKVAHLLIGAQVRATSPMVAALTVAESFMAGFEDDATQEGIAGSLATIRAAIALATDGTPLPAAPEHPAQDADQVEAARRAFNGMLESLKTLTTQARSVIDTVDREDVPEWFAAVEAAEATIAAAEGREIAGAPKVEPAPADFEQRRDGWLIAFVPISSAARQWSIDASPKGARWEHERWYAQKNRAPAVRHAIEAEGFTVREG